MKIHSAEFILSASSPKQFPIDPKLPEIAFAGRSNVGKSSLINSLLNRKKLVKISSTPGKTQLINFFKINNKFNFVDLPGYGYAKVSENIRHQWKNLIESYLNERGNLRKVVLIVDSRHSPTFQDVQLKDWLDYYKRPTMVIASKIDKLKKSQIQKNLEQIRKKMSLEALPLSHSSFLNNKRDEIWKRLIPYLGPIIL